MYSNRKQLGTYSIWQRRIGHDVLNTRTPPSVTLEAVIREVPGLSLALAYMPVPDVKQVNPPLKNRCPNFQQATPKGKFGRRSGGVTRSEELQAHDRRLNAQSCPEYYCGMPFERERRTSSAE
jgi:hypothetical protein